PPRRDRPERSASPRPERPRRERPAPPPPKPKPKKLRPARAHREALLQSLSPEQQPIAEQLMRGGMPGVRAALEEQNAKAEAEQQEWLQDLTSSLDGGRVVRALRLSARPPQPTETLPGDLGTRLADAASAAMTADIASDRWATLLDAVAYSPVRRNVVPAGAPAEPADDLLAMARKHAGRVPSAAKLFGIEPPAPPARRAPKPRPKPAPE